MRFGGQTDDVSQGRWPDGSANTLFMFTPSPRAANAIPANPPAEIRILRVDASPDSYFALSWNAEPGGIYRLQYRADLSAAAWTDLAGDVFAYSHTASKADPRPIGGNQRFYRVLRIQ